MLNWTKASPMPTKWFKKCHPHMKEDTWFLNKDNGPYYKIFPGVFSQALIGNIAPSNLYGAPIDFFLFSMMKTAVKVVQFRTIEVIQIDAKKALNQISRAFPGCVSCIKLFLAQVCECPWNVHWRILNVCKIILNECIVTNFTEILFWELCLRVSVIFKY